MTSLPTCASSQEVVLWPELPKDVAVGLSRVFVDAAQVQRGNAG